MPAEFGKMPREKDLMSLQQKTLFDIEVSSFNDEVLFIGAALDSGHDRAAPGMSTGVCCIIFPSGCQGTAL
jgi:hypothetical protein